MLKGFFPVLFFFLCTDYCFAQNASEPNLKEEPLYTNLNKALRHVEKAYKLSLKDNKLGIIPEEIFKLTELRILLLDSNGIKSIPPQIKELKKLRVLSLSYNDIEALPAEIGSLTDLNYLYLDHNKLSELPQEFFYLSSLDYLLLNDNKLKTFPPNFRNMKELRSLDCSNNEIESLPEDIGHLYSLEGISFSNNQLSTFPLTFFGLNALERLYLGNNNFTSLPADIEKLRNLEILMLDSNKLTSLPPAIDHLYNLKKLYLNSNQISTLPSELDDMVSLTHLDIGNNPVRFHNDINQLSKLEYLYAKNLAFEKFPQELFDLQNNGTKIIGLKSNEPYNIKLLVSQGKNKQLVKEYDVAIQKYAKALVSDTNNAEALSGMAACYVEKEQYDSAEVVCKRAMTKNPNATLLKEIKATYMLTQLRTNKYGEMIQSYEAKIKLGTSDAGTCFELGKYYYDNEKFSDAEKILQRAVQMDPNHSYSHFYLAAIALMNDKTESFVFSCLRFLSLNDEGNRTETILPFLFSKMKMKTGVKNKKGGTSYFDNYILRDEDGEIVYKNDNPINDLAIAMLADLLGGDITIDKKSREDTSAVNIVNELFNVNKTNVEIFQKELKMLCDTKAEDKKQENDFYWNYYLPYFSAMISSNNAEAFSYQINKMRREENYISDWLMSNKEKTDKLKEWNKNYKWKKE